jgi:hypothetical protein
LPPPEGAKDGIAATAEASVAAVRVPPILIDSIATVLITPLYEDVLDCFRPYILFPCDAESFLISNKAEGIWSKTAKRTTNKTVQVTRRVSVTCVATSSSKINRD